MKNWITALLALALMAFVGCKKETDTDSSAFSCKIDGTSFSVKGVNAYATTFSTYFTVYGVNPDDNTETVYLSFPLGTKEGTYTLNGDFTGYFVDKNDVAYSNLWGQGGGTVTISKIDDTHVEGTFEINVYDSDTEAIKKALTDGKFDVAFR